MSNVLKVNSKTKVNVQLFENYGKENFKVPTPEEILEKKVRMSFEEGYEKGLSDGKKEMEEKYSSEIERIKEEVNNLFESVDTSLKGLEKVLSEKVFHLSVAIAEKIIDREVENKSTIEENIKKALKKLSGAVRLTVKVNPGETEYAKRIIAEENKETFRQISLETDERLNAGECIVESEIGNVSTKFDNQLEEIVKDFEKYFAGI